MSLYIIKSATTSLNRQHIDHRLWPVIMEVHTIDAEANLSCQYDLASTIRQLGSKESIWLDPTVSPRIGASR